MFRAEVWKFIRDCKLNADKKKLPSSKLDQILATSCSRINTNTTANNGTTSTSGGKDNALCRIDFTYCLIRIAYAKYKEGSVSQRLSDMMVHDINNNAFKVEVDVFRDKISSPKMVEILQRHQVKLRKIYDIYSAADDTGDAVLSLSTMNIRELVKLFRDLGLINSLLTERAVIRIFNYVQQETEDEDFSKEDSDTASDDTDSEMVFSEFLEAMVILT